MKNINITEFIRNVLPMDSFSFNPSIAQVTGDTFLITVHSFAGKIGLPIPDERNNHKNTQHPWNVKWKGEENATYVFPAVLVGESLQPLRQDIYPLKIDALDTRIFRFYQTGTEISYILTYNNNEWSYLVVDINTLEYSHIQGRESLCLNQDQKNCSLLSIERDETIDLLLSCSFHTVFSIVLQDIENGYIHASSMLTQQPKSQGDFLEALEKYHNHQLFFSFSTPSYRIANTDLYQGVGYIKVKLDYLRRSPKGHLKKFKKWTNSPLLHDMYVYFMFIYQFKFKHNIENGSQSIELIKMSHPFIVNREYLLNFPAGQIILETGETIISYGNGDREAYLLRLSYSEVNEMVIPIEDLSPAKLNFIFLE